MFIRQRFCRSLIREFVGILISCHFTTLSIFSDILLPYMMANRKWAPNFFGPRRLKDSTEPMMFHWDFSMKTILHAFIPHGIYFLLVHSVIELTKNVIHNKYWYDLDTQYFSLTFPNKSQYYWDRKKIEWIGYWWLMDLLLSLSLYIPSDTMSHISA